MAGERTRVAPATHQRSRVVLVLVALALVGGALPSFSVGANLMIITVGGALFAGGLVVGSRAAPAIRSFPPGTRWWLVPIGGLCLLESLTYLLGSTYDHPTLSQLADPWLDRYPVRSGVFLGWVAAFWALARR